MAKKVTKQALIAERGITLIKEIVLSMSSRWNPTESMDVGIDGMVELVDPDSGAALGALLAVQSKATEKKFKAETESGFEWTCSDADLSYWLQVNMPVLLIVTRPPTREAYWICVQEHFRGPQARISRTAHVDKERDRFDKSCFPALLRLGRSASASQRLLLLRGPIELLGLGELAQRSAVLTDPSRRAQALLELEGALREQGYRIQAHEVMGRRAESLMTAGQPRAAADVWLDLLADQLEFGAWGAPRVALARLGERVPKLSAERRAKVSVIRARIDWQDLGHPVNPVADAAKALVARRSPWAGRALLWAAECALVDDDVAATATLGPRVKRFLGASAQGSNLRLRIWYADTRGAWDPLLVEAANGQLSDADAGLVYCRRGRWLADHGQPDEALDAFAQAASHLAQADLMGDAAECHFSMQWIRLESGPFPDSQSQDAIARTQLRQRRRLAGDRDFHVAFLEKMHDGELAEAHEFIRRALWEAVISGHLSDERWAHARLGDLLAASDDPVAAVAAYILAGSADRARELASDLEIPIAPDLSRLQGRPHRLGSAIAVIGAQADVIPSANVRGVVPLLLQFAHGVRQAPTSPTVAKEAVDALADLSARFTVREAKACLNFLASAIPRPPATATDSGTWRLYCPDGGVTDSSMSSWASPPRTRPGTAPSMSWSGTASTR